jgi:hypothetical protein
LVISLGGLEQVLALFFTWVHGAFVLFDLLRDFLGLIIGVLVISVATGHSRF